MAFIYVFITPLATNIKNKSLRAQPFSAKLLQAPNYIYHMKKGKPGLSFIRPALSKEGPKQEHFSYFQTLEQKLLHQSDKITSLIDKPPPSSESHSLKSSPTSTKPFSQKFLHSSKEFNTSVELSQQRDRETNCSMILQNYLDNKKNFLNASKSQYFPTPKEKEAEMQRKLTYNLTRPHEYPKVEPQEISSPSRSDKAHEHLKKTASTNGSSAALFKTIDKIKRMSNNRTSHGSSTSSQRSSSKSIRQPCLGVKDFEVIKFLEEGQFGAVYLVRHKPTNFVCALKKIAKRIFHGEEKFINQLIRQIKIQIFLDHPNIVQLYSFFADEDHIYLILEVCCGGNIYASLQKDGRLPEDRVRSILKQVSHAIEFMHDSDIIHRDIKPENILMHENIAKVCDFGWSIHSPLLRDTLCGTPLYSSPEVVQKQHYDNKIDIWNIGIFTYELIFGRVPFQIRTEDDLTKVVDDDIYFPKSVPITSEAKDFILKCLHKNPKERLPMAKLVDHEFLQH